MKSIAFLILPLSLVSSSSFLNINGGSVPQASKIGGEYFEKYELDYGSDDKVRLAGSLRGFIKTGKISNLKEKDPFLKWWNEYLEKGPTDIPGRIKPIYAADFGTKADLKKGEHPKIIIVTRKLIPSSTGELTPPSSSSSFIKNSKNNNKNNHKNNNNIKKNDDNNDKFDIEIREISQPWLRSRCQFAVRYIVPNRLNILKLMESKGRFVSQVEVEETANSSSGPTVWAKMKIKPSFTQRLLGKREVVLKRQLSNDVLQNSLHTSRTSSRSSSRISSSSKGKRSSGSSSLSVNSIVNSVKEKLKI